MTNEIEVTLYGQFCPMYDQQLINIKEAIRTSKRKVAVKTINDMYDMEKDGIHSFPSLMINGKLVAKGSVASTEKLTELFSKIK